MRTTRLAAAGAAAAIALSGTVAAATSTTGEQTVTITVTAAPLTLSLTDGTAVTFELSVNDESVDEKNLSGRLTYQNPTGSDTENAKVTVTRDATDLSNTGSGRALVLGVRANMNDVTTGDEGDKSAERTFSGDTGSEQDLITGIGRHDEEAAGVMLVLTLTGNAGNTVIDGTNLQTTLTYTIQDQPAS